MFSSDIPMILWYTIPSFKLVSFELQTQDPSLMVETCFILPGLKVPPIGLVVVNSSHEEPGCFFVKEVET